MREDQTQLFKMEYGTRCDTFGCGEAGAFFVGRPDGPLNTSHILCQICTDSLIASVHELLVDEALFGSNGELAVMPDFDFEYLEDAKTHATLDEIIADLGLKGIPSREDAKLQERKDAIAAAVK